MHAYQPERLIENTNQKNKAMQLFSDYPALCSGAVLSVLIIVSVFANAVFFQTGKHPSPLFSTRNINVVKPLDEDVKTASKQDAKSAETAKKVAQKDSVTSKELLREVQTALSVRGYYAGKLDGVYGSRTQKAITSFQKDHSLKTDGEATVRLLTQVLMSASARPEEVPVPQKVQVATSDQKPKTLEASAIVEDVADGLVARIQSGLRNYGYDDLEVDGKMGQQTATAIQRFQLDYGMKITGEPSKGVLKKLSDIGAYRQG